MKMKMLKDHLPAILAGAMSAAINIAVLKTDVDWLKETVQRHEAQIIFLLTNGGKAYAESR
jgi:hypothetical protein